MWRGAGQAGTFGMMQLAQPAKLQRGRSAFRLSQRERKAEVEIRFCYLYGNCQGAAPRSPGEKGRKGEGRTKPRKHGQENA